MQHYYAEPDGDSYAWLYRNLSSNLILTETVTFTLCNMYVAYPEDAGDSLAAARKAVEDSRAPAPVEGQLPPNENPPRVVNVRMEIEPGKSKLLMISQARRRKRTRRAVSGPRRLCLRNHPSALYSSPFLGPLKNASVSCLGGSRSSVTRRCKAASFCPGRVKWQWTWMRRPEAADTEAGAMRTPQCGEEGQKIDFGDGLCPCAFVSPPGGVGVVVPLSGSSICSSEL